MVKTRVKMAVAQMLGSMGYVVSRKETLSGFRRALADSGEQLTAAEARLGEAESRINAKGNQLAAALTQLDATTARLDSAEARLVARTQELDRREAQASERATAARSAREARGRQQYALWKVLERETVADYYFAMDVVGTCTLRCPSCPVGNSAAQLPKGIMSLKMYQDILEKILREHPGERVFIDLFNWGESLLHKGLADMIRLATERGIKVGLSTNMNQFPNMRDIIRAKPSYIRISLSGFTNGIYQQTHEGGDINLVKSNMHLLRHHMDEVGIEIPVQVGFHVYRTNFPSDFNAMRELCDELNFYFMPSIATFMPLEKAFHIEDGTLEPKDKTLLDKLVVPMGERCDILGASRQPDQRCDFQDRRTAINFDGSVALCCATYNNEQLIASNYLEAARADLQQKKYSHPFCDTCIGKNLDMVFTGANSHLIERRAAELLGPEFAEFLEDRSTPWS